MTAPPATSGTLSQRIQRYGVTSTALAWSAASGVPPWAAQIISRYAPVAVVMNDFYWRLFGESRKTPYPTAEIERARAEFGFWPIADPVR